jgi:hypothetical protein
LLIGIPALEWYGICKSNVGYYPFLVKYALR